MEKSLNELENKIEKERDNIKLNIFDSKKLEFCVNDQKMNTSILGNLNTKPTSKSNNWLY